MANQEPTLSGESFKILHIEDDLGDAQLLRSLIEKSSVPNIHLHHVDRLNEGLAYLRQNTVDLIFLDVELPDAVAIEFDNIALRRCSQAPIVLMTGMAREDVSGALNNHPSLGYENKNDMTTESLTAVITAHDSSAMGSDMPSTKDQNLQWENLLNSMADAVIVVDSSANAHWANDAGWKLLEYDWVRDLKRILEKVGSRPSSLIIDIANGTNGKVTRYDARLDPYRGKDTDHLVIVSLRALRD